MMKQYIMTSAAILTAATALYPVTAHAALSSNFELRKKVVGMSGIMNITNVQEPVSRGELARILTNASSIGSGVSKTSGTSVFADVPRSNEYASYVRTAVEKGWMSGYLGGVFRPDQKATLQEAVKGTLALLGYTDSDFTGDQIGGRMEKYRSLELDENIDRDADEIITREDCIQLVYNLLKTKPKDGGDIYGKLFGCELTADGEINPLTLADNGLKGPKLIKSKRALKSYIPFKLENANVFINGEASTVHTLETALESDEAALIYYHPGAKAIWAYTQDGEDSKRGMVRGTVTNIYYTSTDVMTPSAVTLSEGGEQYLIKNSEMQFAFSMYGNIRVGDSVTLVYEKTGTDDVEYVVVDCLEE